MDFKQLIVSILVPTLGLLSLCNLQAQVTIGSSKSAAPGALLQLKDKESNTPGGENASRGLILPRVALENEKSLKGIDVGENADPLSYRGMLVFHAQNIDNECITMPAGMYVWNGDSWRMLSNEGKSVINKSKGSYMGDLRALKELMDVNPNAGLRWEINLENGTISNASQLKWKEVCGEKRLTRLNFYDSNKNLSILDTKAFSELQMLRIDESQLSNLDLSENKKLTDLSCNSSPIRELNVNALQELKSLSVYNCRNLTTIDVSKNTKLQSFMSYDSRKGATKFSSLDFSNNPDLKVIDCTNNELTSLNLNGTTKLEWLMIRGNKLSEIDLSHNQFLTKIECADNKLGKLILDNNPELLEVDAQDNSLLKTISLTKNKKLKKLIISSTPITELNLSQNTELEELTGIYCSAIQKLNLNSNPKLHTLTFWGHTNLTTVLLTGAVELKKVELHGVGSAKIGPSIDFSKNVKLEYLNISSNALTALNLDENVLLTYLNCRSNQLPSIKVDENTKLKILDTGYNPINTLDVNKNIALESLTCNKNGLSTLDLNQNKELVLLNVGKNQLTSIDLIPTHKLSILDISENPLTSLDLSVIPSLISLRAGKLAIPLDLTTSPNLGTLTVFENDYTQIDISKNPLLEVLSVTKTKITSLDLRNNPKLRQLELENNKLSELKFGSHTGLYTMNLKANELEKLDVTFPNSLQYLYTDNNPLINIPKSLTICESRLNYWNSSNLSPAKTHPCYNPVPCN